MLLTYQEEELFASPEYDVSIVARLIKGDEDATIQMYVVFDRGQSYSISQYIAYCVKDYAIECYSELFERMFAEMEINITNINSNFSIKDMENGDEKVIIEGSIELD